MCENGHEAVQSTGQRSMKNLGGSADLIHATGTHLKEYVNYDQSEWDFVKNYSSWFHGVSSILNPTISHKHWKL